MENKNNQSSGGDIVRKGKKNPLINTNYVRQAISTKYLGPTNFKGGRVKAQCCGGSIIVNWDHSLNVDHNHAKAAEALIKKLDWGAYNDWAMGSIYKSGYCFVAIAKRGKK